ncbi:MAG: hypothetical protein OXG72_14015, partial [Acidobacteria bacterium]|nr:hypothetical protein [Acidobacteriota bacterium]
GMIVAGGTPPGSGLGSVLTKAASGAQTVAGWTGGASGAGGGGGGQADVPVSVATDRRRAGQAYQEAHRRSGGAGGAGVPGSPPFPRSRGRER